MASTIQKETKLYVALVNSGLLVHIGRNNAPAAIPDTLKKGKELSPPQREKLNGIVDSQLGSLRKAEGNVVEEEEFKDDPEKLRERLVSLREIVLFKNPEDTETLLLRIEEAAKILNVDIDGSGGSGSVRETEEDEGGQGETGEQGSKEEEQGEKDQREEESVDINGSGGSGSVRETGEDEGGQGETGEQGSKEEEQGEKNKREEEKGEGRGEEQESQSKENGNDSEYGSWRGPGRERSASPMSEEAQQTLESILQAKCEGAIVALRRYLVSESSEANEAELNKINDRISAEIVDKLTWDADATQGFWIPYKAIADVLGSGYAEAIGRLETSPHDETANKTIREAKLKLYHICLDRGFQPAWFEKLFPNADQNIPTGPKRRYADENMDATSFWPYHYQNNGTEIVLFEKRKKINNGVKSSFGVQIYDEDEGKYKIVLKPSIANLDGWRMSKNALKFDASGRRYDKKEFIDVDWIYFYTTVPIRSANALKNKSDATTEFCVKFNGSIMPKIITRTTLRAFWPEDAINKAMKDMSERDGVTLPWEMTANNIYVPMNDSRGAKVGERRTNMQDLVEMLHGLKFSNDGAMNGGKAPLGSKLGSDELSSIRNEMDSRIGAIHSRVDMMEKDVTDIKEQMVTQKYMEVQLGKLMDLVASRS
ncbi:uncharacterized protein LDX57_013050 [Aspergillus melleus]|uniref:uncharacterized protein n=1 Tax=Aspergillus melleus TaxID=138277 RepID=UPI001E8E6F1A|nr:uncharacterized protein LDX57_013050 [Aspergillus melleus]KAH8435420.1 hypothetical protein LDX57_013050 [Aspergillus melleus]